MNSIYKISKIKKLLLLILIAGISIFWTGDFSTPETAFQSLLSAASSGELDNFLQCCDLESMTGRKVTPDTIDQIIKSLKTDPYRTEIVKKILSYLKNSTFEILEKNEISPEMQTLLIKNTGTKEKAHVLFRKRNGDWKLSTLKPIRDQ